MILRGGNEATDELGEEIRQHVAKKLGRHRPPETVVLVPDLPKTRSGKIMRRLLRDVAEGRALGDTTTLADPNVFEEIRRRADERRPARTDVSDAVARDELGVARRPGRARARRSSSTWTACCPTPPAASTTSSTRSPTGRRSSTPAATTTSSPRSPACST